MIVFLSDDRFGQNLFFTRLLQNIHPDELAEAVGISVEELEQIESGLQLEVEEKILHSLALALHVPLEDLMDE